jgi:ribosomal protein S27E
MDCLVVTCAGCGNKYRGEPNAPPVKCVSCGNTVTFPDGPRVPPSPQVLLCSNCWGEARAHDKLIRCDTCSQKIARLYGGSAAVHRTTTVQLHSKPQETARPASPVPARPTLADILSPQMPLPPAAPSPRPSSLGYGLSKNAGVDSVHAAVELHSLERQAAEPQARSSGRSDHDAQLAELETALALAQQDVERLRKQKQAWLVSEAELNAQLAALKNRLLEGSFSPSQLTSRCGELEMVVAELRTKVEQERRAREAAILERDEQAGRGDQLEKSVQNLEGMLTAEKVAKENLERELGYVSDIRAQLEESNRGLTQRLLQGTRDNAGAAGADADAVLDAARRQIEDVTAEYQTVLKGLAEEAQELFARVHLARRRAEDNAADLAQNVGGLAEEFRKRLEKETDALDARLLQWHSPRRSSGLVTSSAPPRESKSSRLTAIPSGVRKP